MSTTKEQLEAIWNSNELGWLKRHSTTSKKKEQRKIKITFFEKVPVYTIEDTVWAGKKDFASSFSYALINKHFSNSKQWPSNTYETRFVYD